MRWPKRNDLDPSTLPTRFKEPLRISIVVDIQSGDCLSFWKNSVSDSVWAEKNWIIHTLHTTYSFEGVVAEIKDFQSRDYSPSVFVKLDRTSYASDINLKKRRKTMVMVKFAWKSWHLSEEGAWQNFILWNWTRLLRRGCRINFRWQIAPKVKIGNFIPMN